MKAPIFKSVTFSTKLKRIHPSRRPSRSFIGASVQAGLEALSGTTKPATSGFGLKANAQYAGDALRFAVGPEGFVHFVGASAGVVYERVRKADASSEFLTHRGVEGTVFLTAGRFVSLYGRQAYVPGSSQPVRTDAGLQLLLRWQDLETIAGIIEFFTP